MSRSQNPIGAVRRWGSLRRRLPLTISVLLMATVAASGWGAYREVEASALDAAKERLTGAARQLASLLTQSTAQRTAEARGWVANPVFRRALVAGDAASVRGAEAQLELLLATSPQLLSVELWRGSGERLAHAFSGASNDGPGLPTGHTYEPPRAPGIMPLRGVGDVLYSELIAPVPPEAPATPGADSSRAAPSLPVAPAATSDGYLVFRRRAASPNTADAMRRLMGGGISLRFGARAGGVWTDLTSKVPAPPPTTAPNAIVRYDQGDGEAWLGTEAAIGGTPWSVWVELPELTALATAHSFWYRMARVGTVIVVLGTLLAWVTGRYITAPLHELTGAAEAIASGEFSRRVHAGRRDEVGRLAESFNTMADRVQEGYGRLDAGIRDRTRELEEALVALQDAQEQLLRREKLAMLGQLASGVGHELRNPLGVMTNAVYYLEMVQPDAPPEIQEYHGILRAQIGLSEKIVGDLLDFARLKPPRREAVPLADLVDAQKARLTAVPGVTVETQVTRDLPSAHIDPVQIGQIVFNLLLNAVQSLESRGGTVTVTGSADGSQLSLDVQDDGPGVPTELRAKIFEPLFTTKARGIGLGLAVSRSLAEANGGTLTVSESPAGGARFTLTIPVSKPQEAAA